MLTHLANRRVIRLMGEECDSFLQSIITQDIGLLRAQPLIFSAMLTAQGKYFCDFFIWREAEHSLLIDIDETHHDALIAALKRYKLRAKVAIEPTELTVLAASDAPHGDGWQLDPRLPALGWRKIVQHPPLNLPPQGGEDEQREPWGAAAYDSRRLSLGVPDGARDATDRHFLLELGYDALHGVSFTKGCYVGQEPTARMHYRKLLRKGFFVLQSLSSDALPPPTTPIMAGELQLGEMRSSSGSAGLAFCRMDPLQSAWDAQTPITAAGAAITLAIPDYMQSKWALVAEAEESASA